MDELLQAINQKLDALLANQPRQFAPDALYTLPQVAALIGCDSSSVRRAANAGNLKAVDTPAGRQVFGRDVIAWLEAGGRTGRNQADVRLPRKRRTAQAA